MSRPAHAHEKDEELKKEPAAPISGEESPAQTASAPVPAEPDYYGQLLKLKAEFENYRKRTDREKPEIYKEGKAQVLLKLLPIYDLLLKVHEQIQSSHADSDLSHGMEGVFKEFEKIFKEEQISAMDAVGKPYDPLRHEVMGMVESESPEGTVLDVLETGFTLQDKVLRPARVRIAKKTVK